MLALRTPDLTSWLPLLLCRYSSTEEYYRDGSSQQYIPHISTPSLFLVSEDDPFLGQVPIEECSTNPNTILAVTARWAAPAHLLHLCQCLCASYRHKAPVTWPLRCLAYRGGTVRPL